MAAPKILYLVVERGVQQGEGKGVDGAAGNANPAGCREAWQQEKRLQGQGADPRDWEGSTCRNH